jgi:hypothetical protein
VLALQLGRRVPSDAVFIGEIDLQGYLYFGDPIRRSLVTTSKNANMRTIYIPANRWTDDWPAVEVVGGVKVVDGIKLVPVDRITEIVALLWPTAGDAA